MVPVGRIYFATRSAAGKGPRGGTHPPGVFVRADSKGLTGALFVRADSKGLNEVDLPLRHREHREDDTPYTPGVL